MNLLKCILPIIFTSTLVFGESTLSPYVKVGAKGMFSKNETEQEENTYKTEIMPMIGMGLRRIEGRFATDVSTEYSWKEMEDDTNYSYAFPKVMVLSSLFPKSFSSLYFGVGGSFGGIKMNDNFFTGLLANASIGAEIFNLTEKVKGTFQIDVDVPTISTSIEGNKPYPLLGLRLGLGF